MTGKLNTELFKVLDTIKPKNLSESDKEDLLHLFSFTKNAAIWNLIAMLFSELQFHDAVPFIIKKINEKSSFNRNGTLVYALEGLDTLSYFVDLIKIICEQGYEARVMALAIIEKLSPQITNETKQKSLKILKHFYLQTPEDGDYPNSTHHFIDVTKKLLLNSSF